MTGPTTTLSPIFAPEIAVLRGQADRACNVARMHGWTLPDGYMTAVAVAGAALAALNGPAEDVLPALPDSPAKVPAWLTKVANDRASRDARRAVAREMLQAVDRAVILSARAVVRDWIDACVAEFTEAFADFRGLVGRAPHELTGHESAERLTEHAALLRCLTVLTASVTDRGVLAAFSGEAEDIGRDPLWLVLDPQDSASTDEIAAVLKDIHGSFPTTLAQWQRLLRIGVAMAGPGEVAARKETYATALQARYNDFDRGVSDRTFRPLHNPYAAPVGM